MPNDNDTSSKVERYRSAVMTAALAARLLAQHNIAQLLRDIETADAIGPVLDPTLWRDKHEAMEQDREILKAALALAKFARPA
jgi:hypothetical protein